MKGLLEKRGALVQELEGYKKGLADGSITAEERSALDGKMAELKQLDKDIESAKAIEEAEGRSFTPVTKTPKVEAKAGFSFVKALRSIIPASEFKGYESEDLEIDEATEKVLDKNAKAHGRDTGEIVENRSIVITDKEVRYADTSPSAPTVAGQGSATVAEELRQAQDPLLEDSVIFRAGATVMSGLKGNVTFPILANGFEAEIIGETATATEATVSYSTYTMTPKRISLALPISKLFLIQDSVGAEAQIKKWFAQAVARCLDKAVFGKGGQTDLTFNGFFKTDPTNVIADLDIKDVVAMDAGIKANNVFGNLKLVTNHAGAMLTNAKEAGANTIFKTVGVGSQIAGYPTVLSNYVPMNLGVGTDEHGLIIGDFSELRIGQWGGIEIEYIKDYALSRAGQIGLVINAYYDVAQNRAEAFDVASYK